MEPALTERHAEIAPRLHASARREYHREVPLPREEARIITFDVRPPQKNERLMTIHFAAGTDANALSKMIDRGATALAGLLDSKSRIISITVTAAAIILVVAALF